jgi:hypothetical protein
MEPIAVICEDGKAELESTREDLMSSYRSLSSGIPEGWYLPFSRELVTAWDYAHSARAMYLYHSVECIFKYLDLDILTISPLSHQWPWIDRIYEILEKHRRVIDTTPLGGGRTYRPGIKSDATVELVYSHEYDNIEESSRWRVK